MREIIHVNGVPLDSTPFRRSPPRSPELQQPDYLEKFDAETLFFDIFRSEGAVTAIGPPLNNLNEDLDLDETVVNGIVTPVTENSLDRVSVFSFSTGEDSDGSVMIPGVPGEFPIGVDCSGLFANKRVVFTKSKNNKLRWIRDWATFYVREHGVNGILLYDNGSTEYAVDDVLDALDIPGLETAVVVDWPYKYGPPGGPWAGGAERPWDSDYCQYGIMEHARRRFLGGASLVINHDIDELLIGPYGHDIGTELARSSEGAIRYFGTWVHESSVQGGEDISFQDFTLIDARSAPATPKWAADPQRARAATQWKIHSIAGVEVEEVTNFKHRHYRPISTNWKFQRSGSRKVEDTILTEDVVLRDALVRTFGESGETLALRNYTLTRKALPYEQRLTELVRFLRVDRLRGYGVSKEWFWKTHVYVIDFKTENEFRFAFEFALDEASVTLIVAARDDASFHALTKGLADRSSPAVGRDRHLLLKSWELFSPLEDIAGEANNLIMYVVGALSLSPSAEEIPPSAEGESARVRSRPSFRRRLTAAIRSLRNAVSVSRRRR